MPLGHKTRLRRHGVGLSGPRADVAPVGRGRHNTNHADRAPVCGHSNPLTVIALRRPENYSPDQGARFEVHFEKLRHRIGDFGQPFEAAAEPITTGDGRCGIAWSSRDLMPPLLTRAASLFEDGHTVREVAAILRISKSEAGRLRQRAVEEGILAVGGGTDDRSNIIRLVPTSPSLED